MHDFWLVLGRCSMDDVPMKAFSTRDEAVAYALALVEEDVISACENVFNVDVGNAIGVDILQFRNGLPSTVVQVVDFEEGAADWSTY